MKYQDLSVQAVIAFSVRFFVDNLKPIAILTLPYICLSEVIELLPEHSGVYYLSFAAVHLFLGPIIYAALVLFVARRSFQQNIDYRAILSESLALWWPVLLAGLVVGLVSFAGLLLIIIPGVWIAVRLSFTLFFVIVVGLGPDAGLKQSFASTKKPFWLILLSGASFVVPLIVIGVVLEAGASYFAYEPILNVVVNMAFSFFSQILVVVLFRIFMLSVMLPEIANGPPKIRNQKKT